MTPFKEQLKSLQGNQKILGVFIFSLITVVIWISLSLVTSQTKTAISPESQALAKPLNPSINTDVLNSIEGKRIYETSELEDFPIYILLREGGTASVFDASDQTLTVQPGTLNNLNQPAATATPAAQVAIPEPSEEPTPAPTTAPDETTP